MRRILKLVVVCLAVSVGSSSVVFGDFNRGIAAYQLGDYETALKEFRLAAKQGSSSAKFALGLMYEDGKGVVQDYEEAVNWYRKAAEQGHADAQFNLGTMYELGQGVIQENVRAYKWYNIASANGNKSSTRNRDVIAKKMTAADITKAQKLAREWMKKHQK